MRRLLLLSVSAAVLAAPAWAQSPGAGTPAQPAPAQAAAATPVEQVVVTGSRTAQRSRLETPVPVDVIGARDLSRAGALGNEFGVALQQLVPSFNFQRQSNSGTADIVRPAQLRGLSPDQVLVLVNGKRRHTTSVTTIDAKVGRGTAPVDFNAIPTNAIGRIEILRDGAGALYGSDAIAGVINVILDERPEGIETSFTYGAHVTEFEPQRRDITDGETISFTGAFGTPFGEGFFRGGFEYTDREATDRGGLGTVPFFEDPANVPLVGNRVNFKPGDGASETFSLWFNTATAIAPGTEIYAFGTYTDRDGEGTGFFRYPVSAANLIAVYPLGYRPITTGEQQDTALTAGVRGTADAWSFDVSGTYGENTYERGVRNSLNPSLGPTSPTRFRSGETETGQFVLNADASRDLAWSFVEAASLAIGAEYRNEWFESRAGELASYQAGPLAATQDIGAQAGNGLRPEEQRDLSRDVYSLYAELSLDITDTFFVQAAARFEDFSDFGDTLSGKIAARWEFVPGYALRGSFSNSFRAPSLVQVGFAQSSTSFGAGGILTTVNTLPVDDPVARALGARPLEAETAINTTIGLTGEIIDGLSFTLDAFRIDIDDRITLSERIDCVAPLAAAPLCAARNITAANFFTNAINTRTEGFEIVVQYDTTLWGGDLGLSAAYAQSETEVRSVNPAGVAGVVVFGVEERNTIVGAAPDDRTILSADWTDGRLSGLLRATRHGETTRVFNFGGGFEPQQTYGAEWQVDVEAGFVVVPGIEVFAGAANLLDEYPDLSSADISYFGNLPYDVLSPIGMNGRYVYGGVRAAF